MTVSTLRPDGTSSSSSVTVTGAASAHAALNDNSDSSYLTVANTGQLVVTMGNLTLPAGAVIKSGQLRFRGARTSAGTSVVRFRAGDVAPYALPATDFSVTWTSPTTVSAGATFETSNLTDAKADALLIAVIGASPSDTVSIRFYELYVDYTYVTVPTTAVTVGGTITDTNLPEVTWSNTLDSDGGAQTTYEVKVFTDAQYLAGGFDPDTSSPFETSGQTSSAAAGWTPTDPQPDDTYRAYVRVAQTVNGSLHWSDWAYDEYTVSVDLPATPTIAVYAEANEARIRIEITDTPGGAATTDDFELQVSTDGGTTYQHVRGLLADGIITPEAGNTIVYDWEAPNGTAATYRVRARHDYSGVYAASAWAYPRGRINLVTNPKAETATTNWSVAASAGIVSTAISRETCNWHTGAAYCFQVTGINSSGDSTTRTLRLAYKSAGTGGQAVSAQTDYTFSAYVKTIDASADVTLGYRWVVIWYDSGGSTLSTSTQSPYTQDEGVTDQRISYSVASPASAAYAFARLEVACTDPGADDTVTFQATAIMIEAASAAASYGDGDTTGWAWSGTADASESYEIDPVTWTSSDWWIKNPVDPSQNMVVEVHSQVDRNRPVRQGTFHALGATYPVVITDTRAAASGTIVLRTDDEADQALLDDLLDAGVTLLVQAPSTDHWPDRYVRFGDHARNRIADKAFVESVFDTLPWQQVAAPTGVITEYPADAS